MHQHVFKKSDKENYEICEICGSYHSTAQQTPKELYEENDYWSAERGHSTWDEQIGNLTTEEFGISKVNKLISFLPQRNPVLEIACAPGVVLKALYENGYHVFGVEPNGGYFANIWHQCPYATIIKGYFPECTKDFNDEFFDYIIASDVLEHVEDYEAFLMEIHRLLSEDGKAIIMSPIIFEDGKVRERDFLASEHYWIHTKVGLAPLLENIFSDVVYDRWVTGHELLILTK